MMGSGKSAVAKRLGPRLGWRSVDVDDLVVGHLGRSIAAYWSEHGEEAFREAEAAMVREVAAGSRQVVATGGGVVLRRQSTYVMRRSGLVIWLQASPDTLLARTGSGGGRPLLQGGDPLEKLQDLLASRSDVYAAAAHASIATDGRAVETIVDRIEELWNEFS